MQSLASQIESFIQGAGFAAICIAPEPGVPPFAYTVGLTETYGCPELLIFGVGDKVAMSIFHAVVARVKGGERLMDGTVLEKVLNVPCVIKAVSEEVGYRYALNVSSKYKGSDKSPAFQQIVYPDEAGLFPWESRYSENMRRIQADAWKSAH